jgi:beta-galactosidase
LPIPPLAFPASSYASEAFLAEASQWLSGVAGALEPLGFPRGPIVMAQIDDGAMFRFRDGVCDFDYHRDAIGGYRRFLQRKYRRLEALRKAYGDPAATFAKIEPPSRLSAPTAIELCRYLDWAEYQEELLEASLGRLRQALSEGGLGKILTGYTLPPAAERTRLDPERLRRVVDVIGLECSGRASEANRRAIARRTSELAVRAEACQSPAFANLAAGFPFYLPPLDAIDNRFCALTALAYGLRGFNVYMAADRDRWIGAPFDARGRRRASANFWERLLSAFERLSFHELSRAASVHIVLPRSLRLLARTLETFEPFAPALDELFAASTEVGCSEEDLGFSEPLLLEAERFLHLFESELHTAGVAHAYGAADVLDFSLKHASWTIVVSTGALEPALVRNVVSAIKRRRVVTLGPHLPERNECMLPLGRPSPILAVQDAPSLSVVACDTAAIARLVKKNVRRLQLPQLKVEPRTLYATVHHDRRGRARALFVINPSNTEAEARIFGDWGRAVDAIDGQPVRSGPEGLRLRLDSRSVRMLELEEQT